jgi:hypothetical protein
MVEKVEEKTFMDGFVEGWKSVVGPALQPPDIEIPPTRPSGSRFMHGLIEGIEAAKKKIAELH